MEGRAPSRPVPRRQRSEAHSVLFNNAIFHQPANLDNYGTHKTPTSAAGWSGTLVSTCTSRPPVRRG